MDYLKEYLAVNFIMIFIAIIMFIQAIQGYKAHKRVSRYIIAIISLTVLMSFLEVLQELCQFQWKNIGGATACAFFLSVLRPTCLFLFVLLSGEKTKTLLFSFLLVPLSTNFIIYLFTFFPATKESIYYFTEAEKGWIFTLGNSFLAYTSHIISGFYLMYLVFRSLSKLKINHFSQAISILLCALVVIAAVICETIFSNVQGIHLINSSIAISVVFYYLYLYTETDKYDALTGVFNRKTYYNDLAKFDKDISAVIQLDMNGLKYLNDNFGHFEGDKALKTAADIFTWASTRYMYVYRMGGDEFMILVTHDNEDKIKDVIRRIRRDLTNNNYSCAIGYSIKDESNSDILGLIKDAETKMYADKAEFYSNSDIDRRKSKNPRNNNFQ